MIISRKCFCSNLSSIFFSFKHNIPLLSTIVSTLFSSYVSLLISIIFIYTIYIYIYNYICISSFISLYFLSTLFTETNSLWLIYDSIIALEIRTSIVFNLVFPNKLYLIMFLLLNLYNGLKLLFLLQYF